MEDYPRNLKEFDVRFLSEESCREYLLQLRWPDGFRCPRCGCRESSPVRTVLLRCRECRHQTSVTAGTIFQDTRTSLRLWFQAMWWVSGYPPSMIFAINHPTLVKTGLRQKNFL